MNKILMAGLLALSMCIPTHPAPAHHTKLTPNSELPEFIPIRTLGNFYCETIDSIIYELINIKERMSRPDCRPPVRLIFPEAILTTPEIWVKVEDTNNNSWQYLVASFTVGDKNYYTVLERVENDTF